MNTSIVEIRDGRKQRLSAEHQRIEEIVAERTAELRAVEQDLKQAAWVNDLDLVRILIAQKSALEFIIAVQKQRLQSVESQIQSVDLQVQRANEALDLVKKREQAILEKIARNKQHMQTLEQEKREHLALVKLLEKKIADLRRQNEIDQEVELPQARQEVEECENEIRELRGYPPKAHRRASQDSEVGGQRQAQTMKYE